jgi:hypothetical protein
MFVTNASGGDVVSIQVRKLAVRTDTDELRNLADTLGVICYRNAETVRDAADEIDKMRPEVAALRKKLKAARLTLAEDNPQAALEVGT